jgi:hypothetical protein
VPKRICDECAKEKPIENGKTCERGHFFCSSCQLNTVGIFGGARTHCPICRQKLR